MRALISEDIPGIVSKLDKSIDMFSFAYTEYNVVIVIGGE